MKKVLWILLLMGVFNTFPPIDWTIDSSDNLSTFSNASSPARAADTEADAILDSVVGDETGLNEAQKETESEENLEQKTSSPIETFSEWSEAFDKALTTSVSLAFNLALLTLGFVISIRLFLLLLRRKPELIIEIPQNATGDDSLDKLLPGIYFRFRERFVKELEIIEERIEKYADYLSVTEHQTDDDLLFPKIKSEQELNTLINSIQTKTEKQTNLIFQLVSLLFPTHVINISSVLQGPVPLVSNKTKAQKFCVTFELKDLKQQRKPQLLTINRVKNFESDCKNNNISLEFIKTLNLAAEWLSVELLGQQLSNLCFETNRKHPNSKKSRVLNLVGSLYFSKGSPTRQNRLFFYDLAIKKFNKATSLDQNWHVPYKNLGDCYTAKAESDPKKDFAFLRAAISDYEQSKRLLKTIDHASSQSGNIQNRNEELLLDLKITRAKILMGDQIYLEEVWSSINNLGGKVGNHIKRYLDFRKEVFKFSEVLDHQFCLLLLEAACIISIIIRFVTENLIIPLISLFFLLAKVSLLSNYFYLVSGQFSAPLFGSLISLKEIRGHAQQYLILALILNSDFMANVKFEPELMEVNEEIVKRERNVISAIDEINSECCKNLAEKTLSIFDSLMTHNKLGNI
jgi:hypothetical protein